MVNPQLGSGLLQPVRDLVAIWNIDVSDELEQYLDRLEELVLEGDDGSACDFAEAALMMQGATSIYSKKVELVHQMAFKILEQHASGKDGTDAAGNKSRRFVLTAEGCELVEKQIKLMSDEDYLNDDDFEEMAPSLQSRVPLWLMPREESDANRQQYKLSECFIEPTTGAYLFDSKDAKPFRDSIEKGDLLGNPCSPLVPRLPNFEGISFSELKAKKLAVMDGEGSGSPGPMNGFDDEMDGEAFDAGDVQLPCDLDTPDQAAAADPGFDMAAPLGGLSQDYNSMEGQLALEREDPYKQLDKHEHLPGTKPFKTGKTQMKVSADIMVPIEQAAQSLQDHFCWPSEFPGEGSLAEFVPKAAVAINRMGYNEEMRSFATDFRQTLAARRKDNAIARKLLENGDEDENEAEENEFEHEESPENAFAARTPGRSLAGDVDRERQADREREDDIREMEKHIEQLYHEHDEQVRLTLEKEQGLHTDERLPMLYNAVRQWQDSLEPLLEDQHGRPNFDIKHYSEGMVGLVKGRDPTMTEELGFADLIAGMPRWEICRKFLTTLVLTNHGNLDLKSNEDGEFTVRLLDEQTKLQKLAVEAAELAGTVDDDKKKKPEKKPEEAGKENGAPAENQDAPASAKKQQTPAPGRKRARKGAKA